MKPAKLDGISSEAVRKATGRSWDEWLSILDDAGADSWDHKEIVAYLKQDHGLTEWWQQTVTVAYEKARGWRVVGQTADAGFQVGVQKTLFIAADEAWALLASRKGIDCWLGSVDRFTLSEGKHYQTDDGTEGEVRVVKPGTRIRMTWQRPELRKPATLQITLVPSGPEKTSIRVHLETLPSQKSRHEMQAHWRTVLSDLEKLAKP